MSDTSEFDGSWTLVETVSGAVIEVDASGLLRALREAAGVSGCSPTKAEDNE